MGIMDIVRNFNKKRAEKSEKFKQMEEDYRLQKMLEERQKSSNQRALEKFYKEEEEKRIKQELDLIRKRQTSNMWKANDILKKGNSILDSKATVLKGNKKIGIGRGNMLVDNKNKVPIQNKREGMFFRW